MSFEEGFRLHRGRGQSTRGARGGTVQEAHKSVVRGHRGGGNHAGLKGGMADGERRDHLEDQGAGRARLVSSSRPGSAVEGKASPAPSRRWRALHSSRHGDDVVDAA